MAVAIALFSLLILGVIVVGMAYLKPRDSTLRFLLWLCIYNFLSESAMLIASLQGIKNHNIANVHVLLFGIGMFIVLSGIWKKLLGKSFPFGLLIAIPIIYIAVWCLDGFVIHDFETFNPFSQTFIFVINLCLVVYLLNVLLFSRKRGSDIAADRLLIFAFLVHCFGAIIIDSFFNYYISLPAELYSLVGYLGLGVGVVTNFLILLAVRCLIQNKKQFLL